ncbi:MAG: lytic transglycosylase domain-containing protein [Porticoccus sp.]|nr:lytic transglycosylase domain-containing protein [Porticoccus sp.]
MFKGVNKRLLVGWPSPILVLSAVLVLSTILVCCPTAIAEEENNQELLSLLKQTIEQSDSFEDRFDAEVWLMSKSGQLKRYIKNDKKRLNLLKKVHRAATRAQLSPEIVLAVIQIESRFDPYALSRVGARGMMQVMPFWKNEIGRPDDNLMDIDTNLRYGCTILKYYLDKEKGHLTNALARYNGSYGKYWYPEKVLVAWEYWR